MWKRLVATVAIGVLTFAGCSSDDTSVVAQQPATETGLEEAAAAFSAAILDNDAEVSHSYLSAECQGRWSVGDWGANVDAGMMMVSAFMGVELDDLSAGDVTIVEFSETSATVTVAMLGPDGEPIDGTDQGDGQPWVYENGGWRTSSCESMNEANDQAGDAAIGSDELRSCDEVYGDGGTVTVEVLDAPCLDPVTGKQQILGWGDTACVDGRRMWWHDWAWGYLDEPAQEMFEPGDERVPPPDAREACEPTTGG